MKARVRPRMETTIGTIVLDGPTALPGRVLAKPAGGGPGITVHGEPGHAGVETRERVRHAIESAGLKLPAWHVDVRIEPETDLLTGTHDLAIALAVLELTAQLEGRGTRNAVAVGTLQHSGRLSAMRGMYPAAKTAAAGHELLIGPAGNRAEAEAAGPLRALLDISLKSVVEGLGDDDRIDVLKPRAAGWEAADELDGLAGCAQAKDAIEIAVAGGHHVLLGGPRRAPLWTIAREMPGLAGPLDEVERDALLSARSTSGLLDNDPRDWHARPFRAPHFTISPAATGGGTRHDAPAGACTPLRAGECALAHGGVLALDELGNFHRETLEHIRAAAVNGRAGPQGREAQARFQIAALVDERRPTPEEAMRATTARDPRFEELFGIQAWADPRDDGAGTPATARQRRRRISEARERQRQRYGGGTLNGWADGEQLLAAARLNRTARQRLDEAAGTAAREEETALLRVARTIADLRGNATVTADAIDAAVEARRGGSRR